MGFLATTLFLVGWIFFLGALAGVVNPAWMKDRKTGFVPSRLDALLVAAIIPQIFIFFAGMFLVDDTMHTAQVFLFVSFLSLGIWGVYRRGMFGVLAYMQLNPGINKPFYRLPAQVLALVPVFGFVLFTVGLNVFSLPGLVQVGLFFIGEVILMGFGQVFNIRFLPELNQATIPTDHQPDSQLLVPVAEILPVAENSPVPVKKTAPPSLTLPVVRGGSAETFSFSYAEDDGQVCQIKAYALAAGQDRYSKRYLTGVCHPASERRVFWLSRVLGSVTQDTTGQQWEPQTVFDSLDPVVKPGGL